MNDLRSQNRTLAPVRPLGPRTGEIVSAPPRPRVKGNPLFQDSRAAPEADRSQQRTDRRQVAASGRGSANVAGRTGGTRADDRLPLAGSADQAPPSPLSSRVSQELRAMPVSLTAPAAGIGDGPDGTSPTGANGGPGDTRRPAKAPSSRPSKRRELAVEETETVDEERFPWHFSFATNKDEPQELQAKTPLLARAFRSSVG